MATFVLVHGGGHGGWCYDKVSARLREAGHRVLAPSLPGCGEHMNVVSPDIGLDCHITDVVNLLFYEDLMDVILVGHSYGGMVITGVGDRASERIRELVYLDAAHPLDGESLRVVSPRQIEPTYAGAWTVNGAELVMRPQPGMAAFFGISDPEDAAWLEARLTPHPWKCYSEPLILKNGDAARRLPRTNINCTPSLTSARTQEGAYARQVDGDRNYEIDTGHDLMVTEPDWLASTLIEIAAKPAKAG